MTGEREHEEKWYRLCSPLGRGWGQKSRFLPFCLPTEPLSGQAPAENHLTSAVNRSLGVCVRCAFLQLTEYFRGRAHAPELREHALGHPTKGRVGLGGRVGWLWHAGLRGLRRLRDGGGGKIPRFRHGPAKWRDGRVRRIVGRRWNGRRG
jgi:hypothetical protein